MDDALGALGVAAREEAVYRQLLVHGPVGLVTLSDLTSSSLADVRESVDALVALGLVRRAGDQVLVEAPERALGRLVQEATARLVDAQAALGSARLSVPALLAENRSRRHGRAGSAELEMVAPGDFLDVLARLLVETTGELVYLRPDQWALPVSRDADLALLQELRSGRESRALYPVAALAEPTGDVIRRIEAGEKVRVLDEVPTRLVVLGTEAALLPEWWGSPEGQRLLVRQPALVAALRQLFDLLWDRAHVPPGSSEAIHTDGRRQLVAMLAQGLVDDQIARALGCSVRTVRRRVADLLAELGASSRFQAGVRAGERGWT